MGEVTSGGASVGPPFPFDAELDQALPAIRSAMPAYERLEDIPLYRQHVREQAADPSLLTREGRVSVDSLHAPGPKGGPEVRLLILRPTSAAPSPMPVLYYIHGGGMIHGDWTSSGSLRSRW